VAKYRALLESLETKEKKKDNDVEMEITWGVGLKERTESLVKKKLEEQTASTLTPWEEILDKKKVKKKQKKTQQKLQRKESPEDPESEAEDEAFSDDEVDVDMEDSFFRDEIESNEIMKGNSEKKKRSTVGSRKEKKTSEADNNVRTAFFSGRTLFKLFHVGLILFIRLHLSCSLWTIPIISSISV